MSEGGSNGVGRQTQADYLQRTMLVNFSQGIPLTDWFMSVDIPDEPGGAWYFGLFEQSIGGYGGPWGKPKPSFYAMKTLTSSLQGAKVIGSDVTAQNLNNYVDFLQGSHSIRAMWTTGSANTIVNTGYYGTLLLTNTPLYVGQQLAWAGGANGSWSNTNWNNLYGWDNAGGFQATFNSAASVNVDGTYSVSGFQFNVDSVTLNSGKLRFTPGGGNLYVADGCFDTIASVLADAADRNPNDDPTTYTNTPYTFILRKCGGGELALNGNNTFHGSILVGQGYLDLGNDHALGDSANPVTLAGGGIDFNGVSPTTGPFSITAAGPAIGNFRSNTFSRYTFADGGTISNDFTVAGGGDLELAGQLASDHKSLSPRTTLARSLLVASPTIRVLDCRFFRGRRQPQ